MPENPKVLRSVIVVAALLASITLGAAAGLLNRSSHLDGAVLWVVALFCCGLGCWYADRQRPTSPITRVLLGPSLSRTTEGLCLFVVFTVAVAFRFVQLADTPRIVVLDETMFTDVSWWRTFPDLFGIEWNAFPTLARVIHGVPPLFLGLSNWSFRWGCALVGTLGVVPTYWFAKRWWGPPVALIAALILSIGPEAVLWSRIALNNVDAILLGAWTLAAFARMVDRRRCVDAFWVGATAGLGWHTYHGAKLHLPLILVAMVLFAWTDLGFRREVRMLFPVLLVAFGVTILPLIPNIIAQWPYWLSVHTGRLDLAPVSAASGNWEAAVRYVTQRWPPVSLAFSQDVRSSIFPPLLRVPFWCGVALALWRVRDPRYATLLIWCVGFVIVGSLGPGFNAHVVSMLPAASVFPAIAAATLLAPVAHRGFLVEGTATVVVVVWLDAVAYQAGWRTFVYAAAGREARSEVCRAIMEVPLPAIVYVDGAEPWQAPDAAMTLCAITPNPRLQTLPFGRDTLSLDAPSVMVLVFPNRNDDRQWLRSRYPDSVEEPIWDALHQGVLFTVVRLKWIQRPAMLDALSRAETISSVRDS